MKKVIIKPYDEITQILATTQFYDSLGEDIHHRRIWSMNKEKLLPKNRVVEIGGASSSNPYIGYCVELDWWIHPAICESVVDRLKEIRKCLN